MKSAAQRRIEVWADWIGLAEPRRLGTLYATPSRATEIFSFEYDADWLKDGLAQSLDPALRFFSGPQYPHGGKINFGLFLDSSPDRWGRFLMKRREAQTAREEGRTPRALYESDYLLGVYDAHRMGALRFKMEPDGPYLDDNREYASPPWTSLRELEQAASEIERPGAEKATEYKRWLRMLIAPGGSLGGARPKAGVVDTRGHLWIAKFPSANDQVDWGAWEMVVHGLAQKSGVLVSQALARTFNTKHHTFLTKRFDRAGEGRIHFASAMTLLGRTDGDDASNGTSYLELAELLIQHGAQVDADLEQLWRRIVFSICVSNADDHLRNHGFLLAPDGWVLSPAYDMNPDPDAAGLKLNISDVDNAQDLELALEVAPFFRVKAKRAQAIITEIVSSVRAWHEEAQKLGISSAERDQVEPAFRIAMEYTEP